MGTEPTVRNSPESQTLKNSPTLPDSQPPSNPRMFPLCSYIVPIFFLFSWNVYFTVKDSKRLSNIVEEVASCASYQESPIDLSPVTLTKDLSEAIYTPLTSRSVTLSFLQRDLTGVCRAFLIINCSPLQLGLGNSYWIKSNCRYVH